MTDKNPSPVAVCFVLTLFICGGGSEITLRYCRSVVWVFFTCLCPECLTLSSKIVLLLWKANPPNFYSMQSCRLSPDSGPNLTNNFYVKR